MLQKNLDKLSNLLHLDLNYFLVNGIWIYLSYLVSLITGLILAYFYANYLSKEIYGQFIFILSLFSLLGIFSLPGMGQALTLALIKNFQGNYKKTIMVTIYFSLFGAFILLGLAFFYEMQKNVELAYAAITLALIFPFLSFSTYYQSFLTSTRNFQKLALINIFNFTITCLLVILAIIYFPYVWILVGASLGAQLFINIILTFRYLAQTKNQRVDNNYLISGLHLSVTSAISFLSKSVDKFIIGLTLPIQDLALYAIALLIPDQIFGFIRQIVPLLLPKIASLKEKDYKKAILKSFFIAEIVMIILIIGYFFISPLIFMLFLPKYTDILSLTQIYSLTLLSLPTFLFNLLFQKMKKNRFFYIQEITFTGSLIFFLIILVPLSGIKGAIYAQIITRLIYLGLSLILFFRVV